MLKRFYVSPSFNSTSRRSRRKGSTIVLVALSTVVLCGCMAIAVDYGLLVNDANRMQRAADAAALSGANELCKTGTDAASILLDTQRARELAVVVAARNGVTINGLTDVTFPAYNRIEVTAQTTRNFWFARVIPDGATSSSLARKARAGRMALKGLTGASPLAITTVDYATYKGGSPFEVKLIRNQDSDFIPTTATSLDLRLDNSGKSGAVFENDLMYGYTGQTVIGQPINSALTADDVSQGSKLENAVDYRVNAAKGAPWFDTGSNYAYPNYPAKDPRIMTIMVADPSPANNNNPVITARFFVNVYVEAIRRPAQKATYLRIRILPSVSYDSQDPNAILDADGAITGPSAVVLMN
jgi:Flp pilus assembly protein TadG